MPLDPFLLVPRQSLGVRMLSGATVTPTPNAWSVASLGQAPIFTVQGNDVYCDHPEQITTLDLSGWYQDGILDLSACLALETIVGAYNSFSQVILPVGVASLTDVEFEQNGYLSSINLADCPGLVTLNIEMCPINSGVLEMTLNENAMIVADYCYLTTVIFNMPSPVTHVSCLNFNGNSYLNGFSFPAALIDSQLTLNGCDWFNDAALTDLVLKCNPATSGNLDLTGANMPVPEATAINYITGTLTPAGWTCAYNT